MQTILDLIFSALIGGYILLSVHSLNNNLANAASAKTVTTGVQEGMSALNEILEFDLRKAGYNNIGSPNFKLAESSRVTIRADFDNDGHPDSVAYYLGTSPDVAQRNSGSRILYRSYNAGPATAIQLGVTRLRFRYFDGSGLPLATSPGVTDPRAIRNVLVRVDMKVGSTVETKRLPDGTVVNDTTFSSASWEKMIHPVNLR